MFTDVEASTDTTTRMGNEAAARVFAEHDRIIRDQAGAQGGRLIRSTGDGFVLVFDSARGGVACALAIERELARKEPDLHVRIGLSAGDVQEGDGELFGAAVNLAARVMDRAHGGEVLLTDMVRQLAGAMPEARFDDRGRVALKGFPERQRLHRVRPAPGSAPPPVRRRSRRPLVAAALVGVAAGAAVLATVLALTAGDESVAVLPNSVAVVNAATGRVVRDVVVGQQPSQLAAGAGSVWVSNRGDQNVTQIARRSHQVAGTISPGIAVDGLAVGRGGIWVADNTRSLARVIDPDFRTPTGSRPLGPPGVPDASRPMAVTADAVWIAGATTDLVRSDPRTRRIERRRYFSGPLPVVHMFAFNVERPLFAVKRMRQAVNAALDRPALAVRVHSGNATLPARATDQFVPPGVPGFRDLHVYSVRGPDVERARRLADIRGRRPAVLLTCNEPSCVHQARGYSATSPRSASTSPSTGSPSPVCSNFSRSVAGTSRT
jgi:hypothetical protein